MFRSKPYIAYRFGLFTGSAVRWYVEGYTELHAVKHCIPQGQELGIEIHNLRGDFGKRSSLENMLVEDLQHRRFSLIAFDVDVIPNLKMIRAQAGFGHIVGHVAAQKPDFEFYNFRLDELVEIAARLDESLHLDGDPVRRADWNGIKSAAPFEKNYCKASRRKAGNLKGPEWGQALAEYALDHPLHPALKTERPFIRQVHMALYSWTSDYDRHQETFRIHPETLELQPR